MINFRVSTQTLNGICAIKKWINLCRISRVRRSFEQTNWITPFPIILRRSAFVYFHPRRFAKLSRCNENNLISLHNQINQFFSSSEFLFCYFTCKKSYFFARLCKNNESSTFPLHNIFRSTYPAASVLTLLCNHKASTSIEDRRNTLHRLTSMCADKFLEVNSLSFFPNRKQV